MTGGRLSQHFSLEEFNGRTQNVLKPYFNQTHIFIALYKETEALKEGKKKFPPFVFGSTQPGLILINKEEWLTVERAIDKALTSWRLQDKMSRQGDKRTLTARVWEDYEANQS